VFKLAAIREGLSVAGAERRGGAQREGIVTSNVRYRGAEPGEPFDERSMTASGLIPTAGADMMISMEPMEALRHARYLHENSVVIVNDFPLLPVSVRMGSFNYPDLQGIYDGLREFTPRVYVFNIDELSRGHFRSLRQVNTICLGLACGLGNLPVSPDSLLETIKEQFPDYETNSRAFELGRKLARSSS
ncbi:MAG TPA: hypothetical protein ENN21_08915, partial [Spirochaetes bacterium]|nr:hypothetical protein [Spirochaetota bacterium]